MAAVDALTDVQIVAEVAELQPDLAFVLDDCKVPGWLQAWLAFVGVAESSVWARLASNEGMLRTWVTSQLKVDPDTAPTNRVAIAQLINALDVSRRRLTRKLEVDAEERAAKLPRTLLKGDHVRLRVAISAAHLKGKSMDEKDAPSPASIEATLEQIDDGEIIPESRKQVTTVEEPASDENYTASLRATGAAYFKRGHSEVAAPTTPEAFRRRMRVLQNKWLMVKLKLPSRAQLASLSADVFQDLVEYILGAQVAGLETSDASQRAIARPLWADVLNYELQVRKQAYKLFNEAAEPLDSAIQKAMADVLIKGRCLTIPMAISAAVGFSLAQHAPTSGDQVGSRIGACAAQMGARDRERRGQPTEEMRAF